LKQISDKLANEMLIQQRKRICILLKNFLLAAM